MTLPRRSRQRTVSKTTTANCAIQYPFHANETRSCRAGGALSGMLLRGSGERQSESSCRLDERRVEETRAQDEHSTDDQRMPWAVRSLQRGDYLVPLGRQCGWGVYAISPTTPPYWNGVWQVEKQGMHYNSLV